VSGPVRVWSAIQERDGIRQVVLAATTAGLVWWLFVRTVTPADLLVFLHAGNQVARGLTPYLPLNSSQIWSGSAFVYPYFSAWAFTPLSQLPPHLAATIYFVLSIAALALAARLLAGPRCGPAPVLLTIVAEPTVRALQLGTVNVWLLLGLAVAWRYRQHAVPLVAAIVVVTVAKLFLLPMLVWLVITGRYRAALSAGALAATLVVAGGLVVNLSPTDFARMLSLLSDHEALQSSSATKALMLAGLSFGAASALSMLLAAIVIGAGWLAYRRRHDEVVVYIACVLASLIASPIVWTHYFTLLLVIPLVLRWRTSSLILVAAASWLVAQPSGQPGLVRLMQPFPHAGLVWAALLAGAVPLCRYGPRVFSLASMASSGSPGPTS